MCLSRILTTNSLTPFVKKVPLAMSPPCSILVNNTQYILADIDCTVLIRRIYISRSCTIISIFQNQYEICSKLAIKRLFSFLANFEQASYIAYASNAYFVHYLLGPHCKFTYVWKQPLIYVTKISCYYILHLQEKIF